MDNQKVTIYEQANLPTLANLSNPDFFTKTAQQVQEHCNKNKLVHVIQNKKYPSVEAWQFAGTLMGIIPCIVSCENISTDTETKYLATAKLISVDGRDVGGVATMICSSAEKLRWDKYKKCWKYRGDEYDEYAICSMAQTRAIGKAFRLVIGWLFKAAGFEATPSEEMDFVRDNGDNTNMPPPKKNGVTISAAIQEINKAKSGQEIKTYFEKIKGGFSEEDKGKLVQACVSRNEAINKVEIMEVKSDSGKKTYKVSYSIANGWGCSCPATRECKHIKTQKVIAQ